MSQEKRTNFNQLTPEERQQYWENYKKLGQPHPLIPKEAPKSEDSGVILEK